MSRPFIMFFTERSGSSSVMFDLDQHPKTVVHMELFGEKYLPHGVEQTDDNRIRLLHELWAGYRNPKWMIPELEGRARGFKFQFKREGVQFNDLPRFAEALKLNNPVVIALRRKDVLRQAISKIRSRALADINAAEWGVWDQHIKPESGPRARAFAREPIRIDVDDLERTLRIIEANNADMEAFLRLCPPAVEITYEDYLADRLSVLNPILAALGLEPFETAPPTTVAKVSDPDLAAAVTNHEEVRRFAAARGLAV